MNCVVYGLLVFVFTIVLVLCYNGFVVVVFCFFLGVWFLCCVVFWVV